MKRWLIMALLLLTYSGSGAIINVAVAWGCANWGQYFTGHMDDWTSQIEARRIWNEIHANEPEVQIGWGSSGTPIRRVVEVFPDSPGARLPFGDISQIEAGWPQRSLIGLVETGPLTQQWHWFFQSPKFKVPCHPLWPGFAINTVFYAAVLWLLFAAPCWVRRRIRARRGQCPACAYPIGSSIFCTECGRPVNGK